MKKLALSASMVLALTACSSSPDAPTPPATNAGMTIGQPDGTQVVVPRNPGKVVSFDFGTVDTLVALGLGNRVVGTPSSVPTYLKNSLPARVDAGSMKEPDHAAVRRLNPDVIMVTGRQGEESEALAKVAPTLDMSLNARDYLSGFEHNVLTLGSLFDKLPEAQQQLRVTAAKIGQAHTRVANSGRRTLVLTHNAGNFSPTEQPLIYSVLQAPRALPAPPAPKPGEPRQRPQPMNLDQVLAADPQVIFIIDRSAAIGAEPLTTEALRASPLSRTSAGREGRIVYLNPALWYLSGGGLLSLSLQLDEAAAAY
ncbi:ABC transporter substrate-binding protein [Stutzerimonas azotifigens]|uniref:ABC transporter substrate-binding protein n=1 Tax=Stutzerimonas azotifigens TaxID=291995 RepID=A0ABR5YZE4_9GAMM|nr:ABC transporter substrate-binding protein [Stutzerimonas azotifigens]MBA1273327.1 ABC transporter substrate-binding protein [Stutzerimonas azotifigens]